MNTQFDPLIQQRAAQQALKRTVVSEYKITLADVNSRTLLLKGAGSALFANGNVTNTNIFLTDTPYRLPPITQCLIIVCSVPISMQYLDANGLVMLAQTINNKFSINGVIANNISLVTLPSGANVSLVYG